MRKGTVTRKTKETEIICSVNLDGIGISNISTGVGFFDHMLELLCHHSLIDIDMVVKGDTHVDLHHTVEDAGYALAQSIIIALGNKEGIRRYGFFYIPMDECLSRCVLDFSGRPELVWNVKLGLKKIGEMDTELFQEFFKAFANEAKCNLHIENLYGKNNHHIIESCYKAFAKSLRLSFEIDDKAKNISKILNKLNISPNYTVFLDDSPVERNRVKEVFPEIESPDYMDNIFDAIEKIHKETWFENVNLTTEDRLRTDSYIASKKIKKISNYNFNKKEIDNWIKNLEIKISQSKLSDKNLKRTIQLMNKTNQLNTITRRMTEEEFLKWKKDYNAETYTYKVKDKFTDYGLTAILSLIHNKQEVKIYDFILSCRIMGRNIENKILQNVIEKYSQKSKSLIVQFNHTEKNKPMFKALMDSGLSNKESSFFWDFNKKYKKLNQIQMSEVD